MQPRHRRHKHGRINFKQRLVKRTEIRGTARQPPCPVNAARGHILPLPEEGDCFLWSLKRLSSKMNIGIANTAPLTVPTVSLGKQLVETFFITRRPGVSFGFVLVGQPCAFLPQRQHSKRRLFDRCGQVQLSISSGWQIRLHFFSATHNLIQAVNHWTHGENQYSSISNSLGV